MKKRLYSVKDNKSIFWSPQEDYNDQTAVRNFAMLVNQNQVIGFCPVDYDLYFVGEFDSDTAQFIPANPIQFVISGRTVYVDKEKDNAKS